MTRIEEKAEEFVQRLSKVCIEFGNMQTFLEMLDDQILWVGSGRSRIYHGKEQMTAAMREFEQFAKMFALGRIDLDYQELSSRECLVYGTVWLGGTKEKPEEEQAVFRISSICMEKEGEMVLRLMQVFEEQKDMSEFLSAQMRKLLRKSEDMDALMSNLPAGVMCCKNTPDLELVDYSEGFLDMFGYTKEDIENRFENSFRKMIYPDDIDSAYAEAQKQIAAQGSKKIEYRIVCKDGKLIDVMDYGQVVSRDEEEIFYCILTDVTESKKAVEDLELSLERHQIIMEQTKDIIFEYDFDSKSILFSENWKKKFGYEAATEDTIEQAVLANHVHKDDVENMRRNANDIRHGKPYVETDIRFRDIEGNYRWCRVRATLQVDNEGMPRKAIGVIIDIDGEKKTMQEFRSRAETDLLTGVYNKGTMSRESMQYLERRAPEEQCALIIIDIDNFKHVNDAYGHLRGDKLLIDFAKGLKDIFRHDDIVGRIGGDEFAILMRNVTGRDIAEERAKEVLEMSSGLMENENYRVSCSIGIATAPRHGTEFLELYRKADMGLYDRKKGKKGGYKVFDSE